MKNEISKKNLRKNFGEILLVRQVFSNLVSLPQANNFSEKVQSLSRVFLTIKKDCRWNEFWLEFNFSSKNEKKKTMWISDKNVIFLKCNLMPRFRAKSGRGCWLIVTFTYFLHTMLYSWYHASAPSSKNNLEVVLTLRKEISLVGI